MHQLSPLQLVDASRASSRSASTTVVRALFALGLLGVSVGMGATACGGGTSGTTSTAAATSSGAGGGTGSTTTSTGGDCEGGVIVDGKCEGKCTPDKCLPGNTCVGNVCKLKCTAHEDCIAGQQDCEPAKEDGTMADITVCTATGLAPVGTPCPFKTECATVLGCPDGKSCDYTQCGGAACTKDEAACGADAACRIGTCPDKSACVVPGCPAASCLPLSCQTNGAGDALAYCTKLDCTDDKECPGGYSCGIVRDPHAICGLMPAKGDNTTCGTTAEACIDPATFGMNGNTYFEGSVCLLRKECLRNDRCSACTTNLDCTMFGQTCVKSGAGNHCLRTCAKTSDCPDGTACVTGSCQPLYMGGCEGKGEFCAPCINDEDCGKKGSSVACQIVNDLTDERGCFDTSFPTACMTDVDCPLSPGNRHGRCLAEADGVNPGDAVYHKCYLPFKIDGFTCGK
jgi:hypothetical protein